MNAASKQGPCRNYDIAGDKIGAKQVHNGLTGLDLSWDTMDKIRLVEVLRDRVNDLRATHTIARR